MIQKSKECYVCHAKTGLERHHIIFGTSGRRRSEKYGLCVWLCQEHHRGTFGVHGKNGTALNKKLKETAQRAFEEQYSHSEWMAIFHKNYLED